MDVLAGLLGLATAGLIAGEVSAFRKGREVARLATAVEQQRIEMAEQRAAAEEASARSSPALNPLMAGRAQRADAAPRPTSAPPPPPPSLSPSPPPATFIPPPPPPLPAGAAPSGDANPFARLAALGAESEESAKKVDNKTSPISLPTAPPEGPPLTESGGWADLMQKVRSAKETEGPALGSPITPLARPAAEAPKAGGADAWEALLKKTSAASAGDNPFAPGDLGRSMPNPVSGPRQDLLGSSSSPASANPFASLGAPATSGGALQPPPSAPEAPQEPLPDFIRKASRTISLDSFKSGEGKL